MTKPKVLLLDIETAPLEALVWGPRDQYVNLDQIDADWSVLCWAAKWLGDKKVHYADVRNQRNKRDDKKILKGIWKLIDEADILVTQNGKSFDIKKLNARFIMNDFEPPRYGAHIDTLRLAKKYFGFTSNKLEYMTEKLNTKYKKLSHGKFPGIKLWRECLKDNKAAWREMEKYNKHDVLALEELYSKLIIWDGNSSVNFTNYTDDGSERVCSCGSRSFMKYGFHITKAGKKQKYRCTKCGSQYLDTKAVKP
jgi:hypothetical protein